MAPSLKHALQSAKADGTDGTLVQPSNWNAEHTLTLNTGNVLGRATAGNGAVEEIPCTAQARTILAAATLADLIAAGIPLFTTGDIKPTIKIVADSGWVMLNDGTIGNDTSGATLASTANAATLYTLLWTNISNTWAAIQDSAGTPTTRGGSASADFAASKRLPLPKVMGRVLGASGAGAALTARALGEQLGEEAHTLLAAEIAPHTHVFTGTPMAAHSHGVTYGSTCVGGGGGADVSGVGTGTKTTSSDSAGTPAGTNANNAGGGGAHNNMQPSTFLNYMIKL